VIQVPRVTRAHRDPLGLLEEAELVVLLLFQVPRATRAHRDPLDQKAPGGLRGYRVPLEFRVNRVFLAPRVILVLRDLLDPLAPLVSEVPLVLLERTQLVRSCPTTSLR